jgi:Predicted Fe-S oxidoreductases
MGNDISIRKLLALEIARKIRINKVKLHPLRQLFWECTLRCNLHCRHCGSDCKKTALQDDMPLQDFLSTIDTIAPHINPAEVCIIITGGEPLMRNDIESCGLALYKKGFPGEWSPTDLLSPANDWMVYWLQDFIPLQLVWMDLQKNTTGCVGILKALSRPQMQLR